MIMFLFRATFWMSLILLILPIDKSDIGPEVSESLSLGKVVELSGGLLSDMSQFCARKPELCDQGQDALYALGEKAKHASTLAFDYLNDATRDDGQDRDQ